MSKQFLRGLTKRLLLTALNSIPLWAGLWMSANSYETSSWKGFAFPGFIASLIFVENFNRAFWYLSSVAVLSLCAAFYFAVVFYIVHLSLLGRQILAAAVGVSLVGILGVAIGLQTVFLSWQFVPEKQIGFAENELYEIRAYNVGRNATMCNGITIYAKLKKGFCNWDKPIYSSCEEGDTVSITFVKTDKVRLEFGTDPMFRKFWAEEINIR